MFRPEDIRDLLRRQPFCPFRIHLSNGQYYDVMHPELAIVTRAMIAVAKPTPGGPDAIGEGVDLVSVLHINKIETLPSSTPAKKT